MPIDGDLLIAPAIVLGIVLLVSGFCLHRMRTLGIKGYAKWRGSSERIVPSSSPAASLITGETIWLMSGGRPGKLLHAPSRLA